MNARAVFMLTSGLLGALSLAVVAFKILWPWHGKTRGLLAQCCHRFCRRAPGPKDAAVERRVREECLKRRAERARTLLTMFSIFSTYFSFSTLFSLAMGVQRVPLLMLAIAQAMHFTKLLLAIFPALLTPKVIDAVYCQSLASMVCLTLFAERASAPSWRFLILVQFLFWGLFDLKPWINAIGAISIYLSEVAAVVWVGAPPEPLVPISMAYFGAVGSLVGIHFCLERSTRFEILAADSKSELTAVQTLLNSICDVVVLLDGQLRMKQHSPKLADLLLQPLSRSFAGSDLRDHMASDTDREVFSGHLCMKDGNVAQASVFHARLRDSTRSNVAMEFFTVGFKSYNGEQHHIVGMREHTDVQPLARQRSEPCVPPLEAAIPHSSQVKGQPCGDQRHAVGAREHADVGPLAVPLRAPEVPPVEVAKPRSSQAQGLPQREQRRTMGAPERADVRPLARQPCEPQLPSVEATPRSSQAEGQPQLQRGTPASVEQCDLRDHRGTPVSASERSGSRGECNDPDLHSDGDSGLNVARREADPEPQDLVPPPPSIETSEVAKIATTNYLLMSWVVKDAGRSCCPMHAAIASLRRVASGMAEKACAPDYGPFTRWQCKRCGIKADEYRDPERRRSSRCLLCRDLGSAALAPKAGAGAASGAAL